LLWLHAIRERRGRPSTFLLLGAELSPTTA
jgi:hypothetical protein